MRRLLIALCALLLCLGAAPAVAQTDPEDPDFTEEVVDEEEIAEQEPGDEEVIDEEEVVDEEEGEEPADDYYYTPGCDVDDIGTEGDYVYCYPSAADGDPPETDQEEDGDEDEGGSGGNAESAQALPAGTLPATGGHPVVIALIGLGFILVGSGGRLRLSRP